MSAWTQEKAIEAFEELAEETEELTGSSAGSEGFTRWHLRAETTLEEVLGGDSNYVERFKNIRWKPGRITGLFSGFREARRQVGPMLNQARRRAYLAGLEQARGILLAARDHVEAQGLR